MDLELKEISRKECSCGRVHNVSIKEVVIEEDALSRIPELISQVSEEKNVYVVNDINTKEAAGDKVQSILKAAGF